MEAEVIELNLIIVGDTVEIINKNRPRTYGRIGKVVDSEGDMRAVKLEDGCAPWYCKSELKKFAHK